MTSISTLRKGYISFFVCLGLMLVSGLMSLQLVAQTNKTSSIKNYFDPNGIVVNKAFYPVAETARQMLETQTRSGGVNKFEHMPTLTPTKFQPVVRMNRDAYYSKVVVDVSKGATITLPEMPEGKYLSMQPVTEDHRPQPMSYGGGTFQLATHTGTHLVVIIRLDSRLTPKQAQSYQSKMRIDANSNELFSAAPIEKSSFDQVENDLKEHVSELIKRLGFAKFSAIMFSSPTDESRGYYQPEINQVAAAVGWGGALARDNIYETSPVFPATGCYQLTFEDPKNRDFWSVTVYNKQGFMFNDIANKNSYKTKPNADGTFTVSLGCGNDYPNNIPTENDSGVFSITVRHYGPSDKVRKQGYRLTPLMKKVK
jgi:hypothetical protein